MLDRGEVSAVVPPENFAHRGTQLGELKQRFLDALTLATCSHWVRYGSRGNKHEPL